MACFCPESAPMWTRLWSGESFEETYSSVTCLKLVIEIEEKGVLFGIMQRFNECFFIYSEQFYILVCMIHTVYTAIVIYTIPPTLKFLLRFFASLCLLSLTRVCSVWKVNEVCVSQRERGWGWVKACRFMFPWLKYKIGPYILNS